MNKQIDRILRIIKTTLLIIIFLHVFEMKAQTATPPAGSGTSGDPYRIATLNNLYWLSQTTSAWAAGTYFIQTADINASSTSGWDGGAGFSPIGGDTEPTFFYANYNGNGHTINGLYINRPSNLNLGLFGTIANTTVQNLGVINVNINGGANNVGGLVGVNRDSDITKCYSTGTITSNATNVGGIIGYNNEYCTVSNSYSTVSIVNNSTYANIGGLVGRNFDRSTVTNSYAAGSVTSTANNVGGFCGWNAGTINNSFWNSSIIFTGIGSGTTTGATGKTTTQMQTLSTFTSAGWDFKGETTNGANDIWGINDIDNGAYPYLSWQGYGMEIIPSGSGNSSSDPYIIATLDNLYWITQNSSSWGNKYFKQTANIDASSSKIWNGGLGFTPIGEFNGAFGGYYDGDGHTISGLYINNPSQRDAGLFGIVYSHSIIKNLGVINANITADFYVGIIAGSIPFGSIVENCYSTGTVRGNNTVGGIVGVAGSIATSFDTRPFNMSDCYSTASVYADERAGGLIGDALGDVDSIEVLNITNSYSTGAVYCDISAGGIVAAFTYGIINNSFSRANIICNLAGGGGLVGQVSSAEINNCYFRGSLNIGGGTTMGGLVGQLESTTINNSYAVTLFLTGSNVDYGTNYIGGLVGNNLSGVATNSFWDNTFNDGFYMQNPITVSAVGIGKSTTEMKTNSTFLNAGWDPSIWNMDAAINSGYPYLDWQNPGGTPLPVELTSLTANVDENKVILNWQTATEVNNYGFEIERTLVISSERPPSQDGVEAGSESRNPNWEKVGFVEGHGNSNSPKHYTFTDDKTSEVLQNVEGLDGKLQYRLKQIDFDGKYEYSETITVETLRATSLPTEFSLEQNYPNPFNPKTTISYALPKASRVKLVIYNSIGQEVEELVNKEQEEGNYILQFDGSNLASGMYIYRLKAGNYVSIKKMLLIK